MTLKRPGAGLLALAFMFLAGPAAAQRVVAVPRNAAPLSGGAAVGLRPAQVAPAGATLFNPAFQPNPSPSLPSVVLPHAAPAPNRSDSPSAASPLSPARGMVEPYAPPRLPAPQPPSQKKETSTRDTATTAFAALESVGAALAPARRSPAVDAAPDLGRFFDAGARRDAPAAPAAPLSVVRSGLSASLLRPEGRERSGVTEAPAAAPAPATGERRLAVLGMAWSFLAIASMYIVMPVRSAFLLTQHGPDVLPWVFMASAAFTGAAAWAYGRFSHRPRAQLLGGTLAVLGAGLVGWWLAAPIAMASAPVSFAFSMWTDAFSIMSVTLFWTYAADRFKGEAVKRWFGFFAAAGALGSIVGSGVTRYLVAAVGAPSLLLIAAATFAAVGLVFRAMERTAYAPAVSAAAPAQSPAAPAESKGAWATAKQIASSPFLLALAALVFLERLVPDFMMYLFNLQAQQAYTTKEAMASFMAGFGMIAGAASLVMSAVATRWMLKRLGVGKTLLSAPLMSLLGFFAMGAAPTLPVTVGANLAEGLPRYTVFKAAKEATYSAADKDVLYRVKAYIEMFVYRFARGIAGLLLLFLTGPAFLAWGPAAVAWAAVPFALAWVYAAWRLGREHARAEAAKKP